MLRPAKIGRDVRDKETEFQLTFQLERIKLFDKMDEKDTEKVELFECNEDDGEKRRKEEEELRR